MLLSFVFSLNWPTGPIQSLSGYVCQSRNVPLQAIVSKGLLLLVSLFGNGDFEQKKDQQVAKSATNCQKKKSKNHTKCAKKCHTVPKSANTMLKKMQQQKTVTIRTRIFCCAFYLST